MYARGPRYGNWIPRDQYRQTRNFGIGKLNPGLVLKHIIRFAYPDVWFDLRVALISCWLKIYANVKLHIH